MKRYRKAVLIGIDVLICGIVGSSLMLISVPENGWTLQLVELFCCIFLFRFGFHVYQQVWRYATSSEYLAIVLADMLGGMLYIAASRLLLANDQQIMLWKAISIIGISCLMTLLSRFLYQRMYSRSKRTEEDKEDATSERSRIRVAIVGAGSVGSLLARELLVNPKAHYIPVCFVDSDSQKAGNIINGLPVYSQQDFAERLPSTVVQEVVIAIPNLSGENRRKLYELYQGMGCKVKIYEAPINEDSAVSGDAKPVMREFRIEDLLFREPIKINGRRTADYYRGQTVLITGGGGSIGSEICRQLAKLGPKQLIVFDCYENCAYDIQQELRIKYGDRLNVAIEISSVRDRTRVNEVMARYRPDIVIHAAAHKHVPLMEHNCGEAVKNNVFGTLNTVEAAERNGVKKFILISTDKAVNPTNVMGATKRMCEMIVQSRRVTGEAERSQTEFTAVRFGNVLGSNGSVIPLFKRQIASGGPITITDKRIIRYFMTIPEAAQLVLEAGAMAKNGELYVLDMGKPILILKLAEDMIRLSGLEPYKDIGIQEIGLREGEKLYEELLVKSEQLTQTDNEMIFIEHDRALSPGAVSAKLDVLRDALEDGSAEAVKAALKQVITSYHDPDEVNLKADQTYEMHEACG